MNYIKNMLKTKEIRNGLLFTFAMLVIIRFGSQLPVPGANRELFSEWYASQTSEAFSFFNAFTGGSFSNFSLFALGITPYITASIIIQLLTIAFPKLEDIQKDGPEGKKKMEKITKGAAVGLALVQAIAYAIGFGRQGLLEEYNVFNVLITVVCLTAGSVLLIWIGDLITDHGVGNGISIILLINILSTIPSDYAALGEQFVFGKIPAIAALSAIIIAAITIGMIVFIVILNGGVHNIPVQYSQKMQGRKTYGGASSQIPVKANPSGVIPVIFASTILQIPSLVCSLFNLSPSGVWGEIIKFLSSSAWFDPAAPLYTFGVILYILMIIGFAYFYTSVSFNPTMVAENIKAQGGSIPGIRPGKPTADFLSNILKYIVFIGAVGLAFIAVVPFILSGVFNASISFGGTSLIIIVSVILETMEQIESKMRIRNYKSFLKG